MKIFSKISPKLSAFVLLFSFLGIYLINIECTLNSLLKQLITSTETLHHDNHLGHQHNDANNYKNEKSSNCCDNELAIVFSSVNALSPNSYQSNFIDLKSNLTYSIITNHTNSIAINSFYKNISPPPPPNINANCFSKRIFIQSFQI